MVDNLSRPTADFSVGAVPRFFQGRQCWSADRRELPSGQIAVHSNRGAELSDQLLNALWGRYVLLQMRRFLAGREQQRQES